MDCCPHRVATLLALFVATCFLGATTAYATNNTRETSRSVRTLTASNSQLNNTKDNNSTIPESGIQTTIQPGADHWGPDLGEAARDESDPAVKPKPDDKSNVTETSTIASSSYSSYSTSYPEGDVSSTTLHPDVVVQCDDDVYIGFPNGTSDVRRRTWLLECPDNNYHTTVWMEMAENLTRCERMLLVGAGHEVLESGRAFLLQDKVSQLVYFPYDKAYVHWAWNNTVEDEDEDESPAFKLNCYCSRVLQEPISRIPMTTPLSAPAEESLGICVINVNEYEAMAFLKMYPVALAFLSELEKNTNRICPQANNVSAHILRPAFANQECRYSNPDLPSSQRFCVCFNISIILEGDSKCREMNPDSRAVSQENLKRLLNKLDYQVPVMVNGTKRIFQIALSAPPLQSSFVWVPILIFALCVVIFSLTSIGFYFKQGFWDDPPKKTKTETNEDPSFEVKMWPPVIHNTLFKDNDSKYLTDDVYFNPEFQDSTPLDTLDEESGESDGGLDNPAFSIDEDEIPSSPPPLSPSYNASFFDRPPDLTSETKPYDQLYPHHQLEMDVIHRQQQQPGTVAPSSTQIINDFSRAVRYNPTKTTMFKKSSISSSTSGGSPKTTPKPKRVGFVTPGTSPTPSRSSSINERRDSKDDNPDAHIYEEVHQVVLESLDEVEETDL